MAQIMTVFGAISKLASFIKTVRRFARKSKTAARDAARDAKLEEMRKILNDIKGGQEEIRKSLSHLLTTTEWRAHEELVIDAYQQIDHRFGELQNFEDNPEMDSDAGRKEWARLASDDMNRALSDIDGAVMGTTTPTLKPLLVMFKDYILSHKQQEGYIYQAEQQIVFQYMIFFIQRQAEAYCVLFNCRDIFELSTDDLKPEDVYEKQALLCQEQCLEGLTSYFEVSPKDRNQAGRNGYLVLHPKASRDFRYWELADNVCSEGKIVYGLRYAKRTSDIGGVQIWEAKPGMFGIPTEEGKWKWPNDSTRSGVYDSRSRSLDKSRYGFDQNVDVQSRSEEEQKVPVLTGVRVAKHGCWFGLEVRFTVLDLVTGELDAGTHEWRSNFLQDQKSTDSKIEKLDVLPNRALAPITGLRAETSFGSGYEPPHSIIIKTLKITGLPSPPNTRTFGTVVFSGSEKPPKPGKSSDDSGDDSDGSGDSD